MDKVIGIGSLGVIGFVVTAMAAWVTHVVWVIKILMSGTEPTLGQIALGVIGAFMPPIGAIHGFVLWFS